MKCTGGEIAGDGKWPCFSFKSDVALGLSHSGPDMSGACSASTFAAQVRELRKRSWRSWFEAGTEDGQLAERAVRLCCGHAAASQGRLQSCAAHAKTLAGVLQSRIHAPSMLAKMLRHAVFAVDLRGHHGTCVSQVSCVSSYHDTAVALPLSVSNPNLLQ